MARKEHFGICHICGEYKKLTYEHIPPEAAFNNQRRQMSTVEELMNDKTDNRAPWDIEGLRYKQFQQGTGFFTLCDKCNNYTGAKYGNTYADFIRSLGTEIMKIPKEGLSISRQPHFSFLFSYSTELVSVPIPSISHFTTSLLFKKRGGSKPIPTPSGVPVEIMVPERRVIPLDSSLII